MPDKKFSVVGIGNAIVDVIANVDDDFLAKHDMKKGSMQLVSEDEARQVYGEIDIVKEMPGGSAANTIAGLASFGSKTAFIGKVKDDPLGNVFERGLKRLGVNCNIRKGKVGIPTGYCVVLVTPDAQRTMNTFLGASETLGPDDIDGDVISDSSVTYLEGYLCGGKESKKAFLKAIEISHKNGGKTALSLSDSLCVDCYRAEFLELVKKNYIDILFANEDEIKSLFGEKSFTGAVEKCRDMKIICALTRSEKGSIIIFKDKTHMISPERNINVVDTTGAGDLYASGFLHGLIKGLDLKSCGKIGSIIAAEVISHFGARPKVSLIELVSGRGF